ncbi:MAG: hypothetical protein HYX72_02200 [Acidobacteria bacterium]|nr:hypothetical protein [Acidobacteriota bacterium]
MITRTIHGFAYNPIRDEIVVPQFYAQAIMSFRGGANGDESPVRMIHGPDTQITNADRLELDPVHGEIFVPLPEGKILVFPSDARDNVAPIRILEGPDTLLRGGPLAVDPVHNLLIVAGERSGGSAQLLIFNRMDSGNVKPRAVISGSKTQLTSINQIAVYPPRELVLVAVGNERSSARDRGALNTPTFVGVWSERDRGDVPPRWTIGGPDGMLLKARGVALDPKSKSVFLSDMHLNSVFTYYFPEIF